MRKKSDLPCKVCPVCERPLAWRRKWRGCWAAVRHGSDPCRKAGRYLRRKAGAA